MNMPKQLQDDRFGFVKLKPRTKIPFEKGWQNIPYSFEDIKPWFDAGNNYGVLGGYGELIIIDADKPEISEIVKSKLPNTFTVQTPRCGHHYYFFCKEVNSKVVLIKNKEHYGEIISKGSQVVGAGSIHPDTKTAYKVTNDIGIATITREQALLAFSEYIPCHDREGNQRKLYNFPTISGAFEGIPEGQRNETIFKLACKLRKTDIPQDIARDLILKAAQKCQPSLSEQEAIKTIDNAYQRYPSGTSKTVRQSHYSEFKAKLQALRGE